MNINVCFLPPVLLAAGTVSDEQQDMAQEQRRGEGQVFFDPENLVI